MKRLRLIFLVCVAYFFAGAASAQLRLPQLPGGGLPELSGVPPPVEPLRQLPAPDLRGTRLAAVADLLNRHRDVVDTDPSGAPIVRGEVAALGPTDAALAAARAAGFVVARERRLDGLDTVLVVLRAPSGMSSADALTRLRALDPQGSYDFNHLYSSSGAVVQNSVAAPPASTAGGAAVRVGLIDSGVDMRHPALRAATLHRHGCGGRAVPAPHGTAVASLLLAAAPGATVYAADVYCGEAIGGAVDALIDALAWLVRERVGVVNVSLVGPPNRLLERALKSLVARGHIVVAAVGNDGPAAPPLYPAAYADVVGVTAVDRRDRVLPEAGRGGHVMFAALGADLKLASAGSDGYADVRGTSFAAPIVAALLAAAHPQPDAAAAPHALAALAVLAVDLGAPGRDPVYGHGMVGVAVRFTQRMEENSGRRR